MNDGEGDATKTEGSKRGERDVPYLVEIKRSARRRNAAAGEHVRREGRYRSFRSKALAKEWAREHSTPGDRVWIQDTLPADSSPADGYLVGGRRRNGKGTTVGSQVSIDTGASE